MMDHPAAASAASAAALAPAGSGADFVVGCRLAIKTTLGDDFEGHVLTYDKSSNVVVLQESGSSGPRRNLRFLKANYIKDLTHLGQVDEPFDVRAQYLDISSLRSREEAAIRQAEAEAERIGVGVSTEAQDIFDALSKTLPVRWEKMSIVVMNEVRVHQPYLPDNVIGGTPAANDRVRKVLELERQRLQGRGTS
ncbi:unnamed protein product [Calypogeia fissa]